MQALQLVRWGADAELREVRVPEPGPGEVLLKVEGAGLCHTDLHLMEWPEGTLPYALPFTIGHETAGRVAAVGSGVRGYAEGDAALVYSPTGCGRCLRCARGEMNLCELSAEATAHGLGMGHHGGLAEYVLVPSTRQLVPLGDVDPALAAPLTDAALTPYAAIKHAMPLLRPGAEVVVIGVGGLGHIAIQLLRALTAARIVAVDVRPAALALAKAAGAHAAVDSSAATAAEIREGLLSRTGAAAALDFVGTDATLALATAVLGDGGHVAIVGVGGGTLPVVTYENPPMGSTIHTPNWGSLPELYEVVDLVRDGHLDIEIERIALEGAMDAYRRMRDGKLVGRAVVTSGKEAA